MIERRPFGQVADQFKTTHHFSSYDFGVKRALMTCLALALLGVLATATGVAMAAYLLLTNSHI
jgi:hypothetical protein